MNDEFIRNQYIFKHLRKLCATDDAKASLADFRYMEEKRQERIQEAMGQPKGKIIKAKKGFFEMLKGKNSEDEVGT